MSKSYYFNPKIKQAEYNLENFLDTKINKYDQMRNFDPGIEHPIRYVSGLSPYISHGVIKEKDILLKVYKANGNSEKFINEIFWRVYWKGWLEQHREIWTIYNESLKKLNAFSKFKENIFNNALEGNTEIEPFNDWIHQIKSYGYLHNHTRMWFASIWIHYLGLPWELGANFFLQNLLDGDVASNTLSWRWVAGIQTPGKKYIATVENLNKYTFNKYPNLKLPNIKNQDFYPEIRKINAISYNKEFSNKLRKAYFILENNLNIKYIIENYKSFKLIILINFNTQVCFSKVVADFKAKLSNDLLLKLKKSGIKVHNLTLPKDNDCLIKLLKLNEIEVVCSDYICQSYENDIFEKFIEGAQIKCEKTLESFYTDTWTFSRKGYFQLKKNISTLINKHIII